MIDLDDERNLVRVLARHRRRARRSVEATALQPPSMASLTMFSRIEVDRVLGEARAGGMLDALIDRQDGDIARAAQPAVVEQLLEIPQHLSASGRCLPPRGRQNPAREDEAALLEKPLALVGKQCVGIVAQQLFDS